MAKVEKEMWIAEGKIIGTVLASNEEVDFKLNGDTLESLTTKMENKEVQIKSNNPIYGVKIDWKVMEL